MTLRSELDFAKAYLSYRFNTPLSARRVMKPISNVRMVIKSGLLAGETRWPEKSPFLIGSGENADIILIDDDIQPLHAEIMVDRDLLGLKISITALGEQVSLPIYGIVPVGQTRVVRGSAMLTIGDVILTIEEPGQRELLAQMAPYEEKLPGSGSPAPVRHAIGNRQVLNVVLSAALIVGGVILMSGVNLPVSSPSAPAAVSVLRPKPIDAEIFVKALDEQIKQAGLQQQLSISRRADGTVEVKGQPPQELFKKWREVLQWYDSKPGAPSLLNLVTEASQGNDLPKIKYVWLGSTPHVILANGRKAAEGDMIENDWRIRKITSDGVTLVLADKEITLSLK